MGQYCMTKGKARKIFLLSPSKTVLGSVSIYNALWRTAIHLGVPQEAMTEIANMGD